MALRNIGMKKSGLDKAGNMAMRNQYGNLQLSQHSAIRQLLQDAFEGMRPVQ
ncbi:MAG: hypothetical protein H0W47_14575 [Polaromonas sp.]|uniref:hypothetical protein n=1 Tax=Polaromonas sp. TaxID=1869339 RepID=UPI001834DEDD|nr:hypothetical protein [Polaromonas sp.]MBA3594997.1 hypothetical protein [Polaromonas sp.]